MLLPSSFCMFVKKSSQNYTTAKNDFYENYTATMKTGLRHNVKWKKHVKNFYTEITTTSEHTYEGD